MPNPTINNLNTVKFQNISEENDQESKDFKIEIMPSNPNVSEKLPINTNKLASDEILENKND